MKEGGVPVQYSHCMFLLHVHTVGVHQYGFTVSKEAELQRCVCCCWRLLLPPALAPAHAHSFRYEL